MREPQAKAINLKDGTKEYHVYCGGVFFSDANDCLDHADYICGEGGYTVVKESDAGYAHTESIFDSSTHDIIVQCNVPRSKVSQ